MPTRLGATVLWAASALAAFGCTPTTDLSASDEPHVRSYTRVGTTQGSAVAVTQDERIAVVTNRTDGIVTVLHLDPKAETAELVLESPRVEIPFHPLHESKPWEVVIAPDDDTAYVLLRGSSQVTRITGLHGKNPRVDGSIGVGSEPTSLAISPSGKRLYVANSAEGTVSVILWEAQSEEKWDLNRRLAVSGLQFGALVAPDDVETSVEQGIWTEAEMRLLRPALAHPRALALTDDGDEDDNDEMLYATEFFSQPSDDVMTQEDPDLNRQGVVYPIIVGIGGGNPPPDANGVPTNIIRLAAVDAKEVGFADAQNQPTACFPNQLYGATAVGDRVYVTSMCASPKGPVDPGLGDEFNDNNFKTLVHPALFAIDTSTQREVIPERVVLTSALNSAYGPEVTGPDRRMPLMPTSIVPTRGENGAEAQAYLTAFGAGAVFPVRREGTTWTLGSPANRFIDLGSGSLPVGIAVLSQQRALVFDDRRPGLAVLDLAASRKVMSLDTRQLDWASDPDTLPQEIVSDAVRAGRRLFATGLEAWSLDGQAWSSCESCHPEGLSDGVTWRFVRGPRKTISLAGTYYRDSTERRLMLWTANVDELHDVESIARNVSGGVGGVVWNPYASTPHKDCRLLYDGQAPKQMGGSKVCDQPRPTTARRNGLNGSLSSITVEAPGAECVGETPCDINGSSDWDNIDAFVRTVQAPHAPSTLDAIRVARGEALFRQHRCAACHGGEGWTLSRVFYTPGLDANGDVPYADPRTQMGYQEGALPVPGLLGSLRTTTYLVPAAAPSSFGTGSVAFRSPPAPTDMATEGALLDYVYAKGSHATAPASPDQLNCAVRSVGTFPPPAMGDDPPNMVGVVPPGAPPIWEGRRIKLKQPSAADPTMLVDAYTDLLAGGKGGFNIPSLVGLALGAPYFHAGNARTLEEVFDPTFAAHYQALSVGFNPTAEDVQALVSYLLSIDETGSSTPVPVPTAELGFDPDLCAQFVQP